MGEWKNLNAPWSADQHVMKYSVSYCPRCDIKRMYALTSCISPSVSRPRHECIGLKTMPCLMIRSNFSSDFRDD